MKKTKKLKNILKPGTDSVKQDAYDKQVYKGLVDTQKLLRENEKELAKFYPPITDLNGDMFASLYKYAPEFIDPELIKSTHRLNYNIMDKIKEATKYTELRESTKLDPILAMMGTSGMQTEIKKILEEEKENIEKLQEELDKLQQAADQAAKDAAGQGQGPGEKSDEEGTTPGQGPGDQMTLEEAKKRLEEKLAEVDEFTDQKFKRTRVNNMIQKTNNNINEVSDMISAWGLDKSSEYMNTGTEGKLAILDEIKNSHKLKEIAQFLGRLKMLKFREGRDKTKKGYQEVTDIIESNRVEKMLVSEMINLLDEDLKLNFITRLFNSKLLTYKLKSKNKNQVGPIIACIDSSGDRITYNKKLSYIYLYTNIK